MYLFLYVIVFVCMQDTELLILTEERQGKVIFRRAILKIYPLSLSHIVFLKQYHLPYQNLVVQSHKGNARKRCEICSKLTIKLPVRCRTVSFFVNFEHILESKRSVVGTRKRRK